MSGVPNGEGFRSASYVQPASRRLVRWSLIVTGALLVAWIVLFGAGRRAVASPGPVTAPHAGVEGTCETCHGPATAGVVDLRCERCHDPLDNHRYSVAGHVTLAGAPAPVSDASTCADCHREHRGREAALGRAGDASCVACHRFPSLGAHPQFAAVKSRQDPVSPLEFSHERHLREFAKTGRARCEPCHVPDPSGAGFEPTVFETQCARCHEKDRALTLNGTDALSSGWVPAALLPSGVKPSPPMSAPDERNRVVIERMAHRDPFVLAAADAIALAVPGGGRARDAVRAREGVLRLSAIAHNVSLAELDDNDLQRWRAVVSDDVAAIDRRLAGGTDAAGIDELNALAATIDPAWARVRTPASPVGGTPERVVDARQFEERRQEIEQLLRAIEARGDERLAQRARALRGQLPSLAPAGGPAPDAHAVAEQLAGVRQALQALRAAGGGRLADDAEALGNRARQQAFAGVAENTRAARQWEMLTLLETAGDRATLLVRARLAEVLGAAAQLPAQDDAVLRDRRDQKQRLLERIGLEQQLRRSSGPSAAPAAARAERASAASALGLLRSRLRTLENGTPASPLEPDRAASAVKGLLNACTKCHRLDDHETGIRPVAAAARPMHAVAFDHKPHVLQTSCETCHGAVQTSRAGTDVNLPPLDTCQSCHGAKAPATCLTCHMYHPKSVTDLMRAAAR